MFYLGLHTLGASDQLVFLLLLPSIAIYWAAFVFMLTPPKERYNSLQQEEVDAVLDSDRLTSLLDDESTGLINEEKKEEIWVKIRRCGRQVCVFCFFNDCFAT